MEQDKLPVFKSAVLPSQHMVFAGFMKQSQRLLGILRQLISDLTMQLFIQPDRATNLVTRVRLKRGKILRIFTLDALQIFGITGVGQQNLGAAYGF